MITKVNQRVQHVVIKTNHPFSVEFMCMITGRTVVEHYAVPLTKMEIQAEYDYIIFPVAKPDYLSYAEQARHREKSGFGM